jgi:hypothetical protein
MLIFNEIHCEPVEPMIRSFEEIVSDTEQRIGANEHSVSKGRKNMYFNRCLGPEKIKFNNIFESLLCITAVIILSGCTINNETGENYTTVSNDSFTEPEEISMKEVFSLDSSVLKNPVGIKFDSEENFYIVEYKSPLIKRFDSSGIFQNSIVTELDSSRVSSLSVINDTLYMGFAKEKRLLKYSGNGSKLGEMNFESEIPNEIEILDGNKMIGSFRTNLAKNEDTYIGIELKSTDNNFRQQKLISSFFGSYFHGNIDPEIRTFPFAVDRKNELIYIGIDSDLSYRIYCYDYSINLKFVIDNKLPPVKFSKEELERRKETSKKFKTPALKSVNKPFIESLLVDSDNNLWVRRASDTSKYGIENSIFDIFDLSGLYKRTILIKNAQRIDLIDMRGNKLFITDPIHSSLFVYETGLVSGSLK